MSLGSLPAETTWSTSAGTLSNLRGGGTYLYAPHSAATATVTATIRKVSLSIDFGVVEPSGIQATLKSSPTDYYNPLPAVGAGMYMDVVLQPTTVSFGWVQMEEPGETATGITGYFTNHTPPNHDTDHGANAWHGVNCANLVVDGYFDHASASVNNWSSGQGGSYTWPIHPLWRVVGDSATHPLNGWTDQVHILGADGTMTVEKLGHTVTRHIYEHNGTAQ